MSGLETSATQNLPEPSAATTPLSLPHVLIADANPASRSRRARHMEMRGYRVSVARTPFETIVKASCHVPDLVVVADSLGDAEETMELLATCPATAHIPLVRLASRTRLPSRTLARPR